MERFFVALTLASVPFDTSNGDKLYLPWKHKERKKEANKTQQTLHPWQSSQELLREFPIQ